MDEINKFDNEEIQAEAALSRAALSAQIPAIRSQFTKLLLANPNYFGTKPGLGFEAVQVMSGNTTYEELECVGFHPQQERLEAVVNIKRPYGFGDGPCGDGTTEYVRFWVKHGATWVDLGTATFTSHDLAGSSFPVSYNLSVELHEPHRYCHNENLVTVRAILSWESEPTGPTDVPAWGNMLDVTVQIEPWHFIDISIADLMKEKLVTLDDDILSHIDLEEKLPVVPPKPLTFAELKVKYAKAEVPPHRFGFGEAVKLVDKPLTKEMFAHLAQPQPGKAIKKTKANEKSTLSAAFAFSNDLVVSAELSDILKQIDLTIGNTTYEELTCVGYNPHTRTVGGVVVINKSSGYMGGLCDPGSTEFVRYWAFYSGAWHDLGGSQVQVHDLNAVSKGEHIHYAVLRPVNLPEHLCEGLHSIPLRAILSWEHMPTGPDYIPTWGNVVNTHIQPTIGVPGLPGVHELRLMAVNNVTVNGILAGGPNVGHADNGIGGSLSYVSGDCRGLLAPFGGDVYISAYFTNAPDYFDAVTGLVNTTNRLLYQVSVREDVLGALETQLSNSFTIGVFPESAPPVTLNQTLQTYGSEKYYTYMAGGAQAVRDDRAAIWNAGGLPEGRYEIIVRGFFWNGFSATLLSTQTRKVHIYNGYPHIENIMGGTVQQFRPELHLQIESPSADCGDVIVGDKLVGSLRVSDRYFSSFDIFVEPISIGGVVQTPNPVRVTNLAVANPAPGMGDPLPGEQTNLSYPAISTNGTTTWHWVLDTTNMPGCGYTVRLRAWDRAIIGTWCGSHYNEVAVGFCLRDK